MTKDLTTGKIMPILVNFTVPLVLGNLFQLTYNAVDSIIVGHCAHAPSAPADARGRIPRQR